MARAARAEMADMRAMEEQTQRQQMHGGAFYGAGATPSMGLSQIRGGASHKCPECRRKRCICEESSSDEDMEGGAWYSGITGAIRGAVRNIRAPRVVRPPPATSTALTAYNPAQAAFTSNPAFRNYALGRMFGQPSTALATRTPGILKTYSPAEAAARIRAAQAAGETNATVAQKLSRMGITPARVAAALALGIPAIALAIYFSEVDGDSSADPGYFNLTAPVGSSGGPTRPGGTVPPPGGPGGPRGRRGRRGATGEGVATGNLADEYYAAQMLGAGKSKGGYTPQVRNMFPLPTAITRPPPISNRPLPSRPVKPNPRAELLRQMMKERGVTLPEASRIVKAEGLY